MSKFKLSLLILLTVISSFISPISQATPVTGLVLWDNWYVVTSQGHPDSYYNEKATIQGDRAKIQVNTWIKEGKKIRSENLGATAKNTPLLEPMIYNFITQVNGEEKSIDGSIINNGKIFSIKVKKGTQPSVASRAEMLPKLILASFFPVWINKNYKRISGVQPIEFQAILEDKVEDQVPVIKGTAYEMLQDDYSKKTNTRKLRVVFNQITAYWWVTKNGDALQIEVPSLGRVVKKTDRAHAESFLNP